MKSILLDSPIHPKATTLLEQEARVLAMYEASLPELRRALAGVNAVIVSSQFPIGQHEIELAPTLEVIGRPGAGIDGRGRQPAVRL